MTTHSLAAIRDDDHEISEDPAHCNLQRVLQGGEVDDSTPRLANEDDEDSVDEQALTQAPTCNKLQAPTCNKLQAPSCNNCNNLQAPTCNNLQQPASSNLQQPASSNLQQAATSCNKLPAPSCNKLPAFACCTQCRLHSVTLPALKAGSLTTGRYYLPVVSLSFLLKYKSPTSRSSRCSLQGPALRAAIRCYTRIASGTYSWLAIQSKSLSNSYTRIATYSWPRFCDVTQAALPPPPPPPPS